MPSLLIQVLLVSASSLLMILPDANPSLFLYEKLTSSSCHSKRFFQEKRVWITGASSGIGQEIAKQLYGYGAKVILSGRRLNELERVGQSCLLSSMEQQQNVGNGGNGGNNASDSDIGNCRDNNVRILPFDMMNGNEIPDIVKEALSYYGGIDILILNAGVGQLSPAVEESYDTTEYMMKVNFHSPVQLAMEVMKQDQWGTMSSSPPLSKHEEFTNSATDDLPEERKKKKKKSRKGGHIVLTSSVASRLPIPLGTSYAASKHAAHGYFTSLRSECSPWLRVDLPMPGPINTKFQTKAINRNKQGQNDDDDDDTEVKMSVGRCAKLIIASTAGPGYLMQETWISKQPTLFFMYLNQYFPKFSNFLLGIIGSLRVKAWNAGLPLYKVSSWIKAAKMEDED